MCIYNLGEVVRMIAPVWLPMAVVALLSRAVSLKIVTLSAPSEIHSMWKCTVYPPNLPPNPPCTSTDPSRHLSPHTLVVEFLGAFLSSK